MKNNQSILTIFAAMFFAGQAIAVNIVAPPGAPLKSCTSVTVDAPTYILLGKATVVKLSRPALRMVVGGLPSSHAGKPVDLNKNTPPGQLQATGVSSNGIADVDVMLLSPTELFLIGKKAGSMNVVLQSVGEQCSVRDLIVTVDPDTLQAKLTELMPEESGIKVRGAENTLVLTGTVSNAVKLDQAMDLANSYSDGKKLVNLLNITSPQQVMLEVKVAEVSKTLLDELGASVNLNRGGSATSFAVLSSFLSNGSGLLSALRLGKTAVSIDGEKDDGLVRILAEPNIMAISGQQASFLSGGKIFIPVSQSSSGTGGIPVITLQEEEYGIGVKFTPTVLDGARINLKLVSEVSELSQTGSPFSSVNGVVSVVPSFTVRRADTTVQLNEGQSLVVAGLIKNNVTAAIKRFPGLGEIPVLGALFRSTQYQKDQTELLFVITPRLVKPLAEVPRLPTDNHIEPSRAQYLLNGSLEGSAPASAVPAIKQKE